MTGAISLSLVNELFNYNYWARDRHLQACAAITEGQFLRPLGGSFPSIRDTLAHLVAVEWLWLERWRIVESEMRQYLASLSEETLERPVTYINPKGQTWTYTLWSMILHLLNHQSYHRGQVATLLRQLGIQPPEVDFLVAHDMGLRP